MPRAKMGRPAFLPSNLPLPAIPAYLRCILGKVRADYKAGVPTVVLPKKEAAKPRSIKIEVSGE